MQKKVPPQQAPLPVNVVTVIEKEVNEWDEFTGAGWNETASECRRGVPIEKTSAKKPLKNS